jgi:hypothetical protein
MSVQRACAPCSELPVHWGYSSATSLNAAAVQALDYTRNQGDRFGEFEFTAEAAGRYLWVAIPQQYGAVPTFVVHPLNVSMVESTADLTVDGESITYSLYRTPSMQYGDGITLESN